MPERKRICVIGLGYIGLPTASLLASKGFQVRGVDVDGKVIHTINGGGIHIREPELDILVKSAVQSGRLTAHAEPAEADVFIIAVPTPLKGSHKPDLDFVEAATRSVAPVLTGDELVILESTCPVGSTEKVAVWLAEERPDLSFPGYQRSKRNPDRTVTVAHCPERVLPGQILRELVENDRIVGGLDEASTEVAAAFYRQFVSGRILETNARTAELAKLTENTFRDVNIALANELSLICDRLGIDVWELIELANHHPRVNILKPGPGVGGHCIAVDPWFIVDSAPEHARLIRTAREINRSKPATVVEKVRASAAGMQEPVIACFGLTYKPDIDDLRESPALEITLKLAERGIGKVIAVEPHIETLPETLSSAGVVLESPERALEQADIVVALVGHSAFRPLATKDLQEKIIIDASGILR